MKHAARSRLSVARVAVVAFALILLSGSCYYMWLRTNTAWGTVGTLDGYDVRLDQSDLEQELRIDLHQWLERTGFRRVSLPSSMLDARGSNLNLHWANSHGQPVAYTASRDGQDIYVVTWAEENADVKSWRGNVYYRSVPSDVTWLPGAESGGDLAKALFDDARSFLKRAGERRRNESLTDPEAVD